MQADTKGNKNEHFQAVHTRIHQGYQSKSKIFQMKQLETQQKRLFLKIKSHIKPCKRTTLWSSFIFIYSRNGTIKANIISPFTLITISPYLFCIWESPLPPVTLISSPYPYDPYLSCPVPLSSSSEVEEEERVEYEAAKEIRLIQRVSNFGA